MSKPSTTSTPKISTQRPQKSAWARGPPQTSTSPAATSTSTSPTRSQSPALPPQQNATNQPVQTHSRRPSALGQKGVAIKDRINILSRGDVGSSKQNSVTFGSIDDSSTMISLSPANVPIIKTEGVKSFGSVPAVNGGGKQLPSYGNQQAGPSSLKQSSSSSNPPPPTIISPTASKPIAPSLSKSESSTFKPDAPARSSTPTPKPTKVDIRKLFRNPPSSSPSVTPQTDSDPFPWISQMPSLLYSRRDAPASPVVENNAPPIHQTHQKRTSVIRMETIEAKERRLAEEKEREEKAKKVEEETKAAEKKRKEEEERRAEEEEMRKKEEEDAEKERIRKEEQERNRREQEERIKREKEAKKAAEGEERKRKEKEEEKRQAVEAEKLRLAKEAEDRRVREEEKVTAKIAEEQKCEEGRVVEIPASEEPPKEQNVERKGTSRGLVLAFDIGTTHSGVSYAFLDPGVQVPEIRSVGRFLNNRRTGGFGIPSVVFYDHDGNFRGVGGTVDDDEAGDLHRIEGWKLKLSLGELPANAKKSIAPGLTKGKLISLQDVFVDFIRYLFDSAKAYFQESDLHGNALWASIESNIHLILSHPNGWGGSEQHFLREAVVKALIFTEEEALSHVSFVTERDATVHFCATHMEPGQSLEPGQKIVIADANEQTIDVVSYTVASMSPLEVEHFRGPECFYQGGETVTARVRAYAKAKFKNTRFDNEQDLAALTEKFDTGLKRCFSRGESPQFIKFGSMWDSDPSCGVRSGRFSLLGSQVEKFFEPSVNAIVEGIEIVTAEADPKKTLVFLIGDLGTSSWIFQEVGRLTANKGLKLSSSDTRTNKAAAVGAISYYLDHFVMGRIVRHTYGTLGSVEYDPSDPEHRKRSHKKYLGITGEFQLDVFLPTLFKGTQVPGTREFRGKIASTCPLPPIPGQIWEVPVVRYTGTSDSPQWMEDEPGKFEKISHISASPSDGIYTTGVSRIGFPSFTQNFEVIFIYGRSEFKAQLAWKERGVEKRGDASTLCDQQRVQGT